ncbi:hypothetical protein BGX27_001390 [Mortierella sp. AM989]|nr:hypothetical protein BGX27_001390 [Mortierella sp. AM989]
MSVVNPSSNSAAVSVNAAPDVGHVKKIAIVAESDSSFSPDKANYNPPIPVMKNDRQESITLRIENLTCKGEHDKTQVKLKLQNVTKHTKPAKNLGDHTSQTFNFSTTVHNMTFDTIKIDLYDVKVFNPQNKIGRAYVSLHDLQKKVGNAYDNDGDDNTEPEQSVRSSRFDAAAFLKKHDDAFDVELPLYKHGSYSKFRHRRRLPEHSMKDDVLISTSSEHGKDISSVYHIPEDAKSESFKELSLDGIKVGMITVKATLHFADQTQNPLFAHLRNGNRGEVSRNNLTAAQLNGQHQQRSVFQISRSNTNLSVDSSSSSQSSIYEDSNSDSRGYSSDQTLPSSSFSEAETGGSPVKTASEPIATSRSAQSGDQQTPGRILQSPSSPPNLSLRYGLPITPPLSPTLPQGSPTSPTRSFQWLSDGTVPHSSLMSWEESQLKNGHRVADDDEDHDSEIMSSMSDLNKDGIKGEDVTDDDRRNEEELMASIKADGSKEKKDMYLNKSDDKDHGKKGKKHKFSLFPEQTRAAFKDIQLIYSSFFGHGWNLSRSEFWRGLHIVEEFYARHPTPTTNKAFDNIDVLEKARHFVRLAIASYGSLPWVYFGYSFKVAPLNFVRFHSDRKNVMDYFKLKTEDMIIWHFDKRTALVPSYYIIREPRYNALCIIIRGTFSVTDAMTDLVCEYYPYKDGLVHKGIMDNARFILENSKDDIVAALKKFNLDTIYCIGHSLGAGSASLLCSLLQDHFAGQKLDIRAYLFAPPPICTVNLAVEWERTQIAFINENDIVCRLSYGNALDLKELIKIGAIESINPAYKGLSNEEKMNKIIKVLEKAQESLRTVDDIPRLVTGGTITYLHKIYEDTPVIQNKKHDRGSKFGMPEYWPAGEDAHSDGPQSSSSSSNTNQFGHHPIARSFSAISTAFHPKSHSTKSHRQGSVSTLGSDDRNNIISSSGTKVPKVTPYRPNQPAVRLESSVSLALSDINERSQESTSLHKSAEENNQGHPLSKIPSLGEPIQYTEPSNARDLTTQRILNDTERNEGSLKDTATGSSENAEDYETDDEDEHKVYTTTKPRKHGSKKKEIRIEFSNRENFMAIPLRKNWLWHHFPQQYDSRVERALAWAKAHKEKEEKKQKQRELRQNKV